MAIPTLVNDQITDAAARPDADASANVEIQRLLSPIYQAATTSLVSAIYSQVTAMVAADAQALLGINADPTSGTSAKETLAGKNLSSALPQALANPAELAVAAFDHTSFGNGEDWSKGVQEVFSTLKKTIWELHELVYATGIDHIKQAALNQVVQQMVAAPEQFGELEKIAQFIKAL